MRRLLYVPIIHADVDLGSLATDIGKASASRYGEQRWARHKKVVAGFWKEVADYLSHVEGARLKVYQDGLAAGGELGRKIVEEGARRGSANYQIILDLIQRGADVRETEALHLLAQEYRRAASLARRASGAEGDAGHVEDDGQQEQLTEERDRFIAARINESLGGGETGILFLGAYHDVIPLLAKDIVVQVLKDPERVKAYFQEFANDIDGNFPESLARYVSAPIKGRRL